jgi:hypothetical protein
MNAGASQPKPCCMRTGILTVGAACAKAGVPAAPNAIPAPRSNAAKVLRDGTGPNRSEEASRVFASFNIELLQAPTNT